MKALKHLWEKFLKEHPKAALWIREGGLYAVVCNAVTVFKYLLLTFLPAAFAFLGTSDIGFPGIIISLWNIDFKWYIIGYGAEQGGTAYFVAYMVAMFTEEIINFFIRRNWVFRSNCNLIRQSLWYLLAFCVVTCIVNSINCIWTAVAGYFVAPWLYNIGATVLNGGVSMVIFFIVNKIVFHEKNGVM